jgi:hypothetical protein
MAIQVRNAFLNAARSDPKTLSCYTGSNDSELQTEEEKLMLYYNTPLTLARALADIDNCPDLTRKRLLVAHITGLDRQGSHTAAPTEQSTQSRFWRAWLAKISTFFWIRPLRTSQQ